MCLYCGVYVVIGVRKGQRYMYSEKERILKSMVAQREKCILFLYPPIILIFFRLVWCLIGMVRFGKNLDAVYMVCFGNDRRF